MDTARRQYDTILSELRNVEAINQTRSKLATFGLRSVFHLTMVEKRRRNLLRQADLVRNKDKWAGRALTADQKQVVSDRISAELLLADTEILARQHDLYLLVESGNNRGAYLRDIVETCGDETSLVVLEGIHGCQNGDFSDVEITTAIYELKRRLRLRNKIA